jgi:hypothetical protein
MISQKDVSQPLFTAYLGSWRDSDEADKGEVSLVTVQQVLNVWANTMIIELLHIRFHRPERYESSRCH